ncbi:MAG: 50S ribosomal protein L13 [Candidatus Anstonellaceae archaeon]
MKIYNAKGQIAGRLASKIAKELLEGEKIIVVNAQDLVISGSYFNNVEKLKIRRSLTDKRNPEHNEKFPAVPYKLFKKMVRGMLPKKTSRSKVALKNLKVYDDIPQDIDQSQIINPNLEKLSLLKYVTLKKICEAFGYKSK